MRRVQLTASGLVQGVFFRASTRDEARRLGLTGWVRNLPDGRVQAEAQGDSNAIERFVDFCRRGPGHAEIEHLTIDEVPIVDVENSFAVQ